MPTAPSVSWPRPSACQSTLRASHRLTDEFSGRRRLDESTAGAIVTPAVSLRFTLPPLSNKGHLTVFSLTFSPRFHTVAHVLPRSLRLRLEGFAVRWPDAAYATRAPGDTPAERKGLEVECLCACMQRRMGDTGVFPLCCGRPSEREQLWVTFISVTVSRVCAEDWKVTLGQQHESGENMIFLILKLSVSSTIQQTLHNELINAVHQRENFKYKVPLRVFYGLWRSAFSLWLCWVRDSGSDTGSDLQVRDDLDGVMSPRSQSLGFGSAAKLASRRRSERGDSCGRSGDVSWRAAPRTDVGVKTFFIKCLFQRMGSDLGVLSVAVLPVLHLFLWNTHTHTHTHTHTQNKHSR